MTKTKPAPRKPPAWTLTTDGLTLTVAAWTKGEARAAFKRQLKLDRLPVGCVVSRATPQAA